MALTNLVPISRREKFLDKIAGESVSISPITRLERFLDAIAKGKAGETPGAPDPITRKEYFLKKISESFTGGVEMEEGSYTPDSSTQTFSVSFSNTHTERPSVFCLYLDNDAESPAYPASNTMLREYYINLDKVSAVSLTEKLYGIAALMYIDTKTSATAIAYKITRPNDNTGSSQNYMPGYWCSNTGITARNYTGCAYKALKYSWIAIWL